MADIKKAGGGANVAFSVGMGVAAELASERSLGYESRVRPLRDALESGILAAIPNAEINGDRTQRLSNTTNLSFPGVESDALLLLLDQEGICASSGSACLADSDEPSHVITAMKPETGTSRHAIRFSLGPENTIDEIDAAMAAVRSAVLALR